MRLLPHHLLALMQQSNAAFGDSVRPEDRRERVLRLRQLMQRPFLAYLRNTHCPTKTQTLRSPESAEPENGTPGPARNQY